MSSHIRTVGKAWIVCRQFSKDFQRFDNETAARLYAEQMARASCGAYAVEIFTCTNNLYVNVPVVEVE